MLGDRQRDAGDVDLLKGVAAENLAGDLAGDGDDRDGVEHGGGEAGDEVGGAGAGGGHADAGAAAGARVAVGHVRGALLVAHEHVVNRGELAQCVVDRKDGSAGVAEDGGGAFAGERGPEDFGAGERGVLVGLMVEFIGRAPWHRECARSKEGRQVEGPQLLFKDVGRVSGENAQDENAQEDCDLDRHRTMVVRNTRCDEYKEGKMNEVKRVSTFGDETNRFRGSRVFCK